MNRRLAIAGGAAILLALALAAVFVAGVRAGANEDAMLQSTVRAALLVGELRALRGGKVESLITSKEIELDGQILQYQRLSDEGHPWLLLPESASFEHDRYLRQVARYRREFPSVIPTLPVMGSDATSIAMREGAANIARTTEQIVRKYGP